MERIVLAGNIARIDDAAPAKLLQIGVEHLNVGALRRHADAVAVTYLRGEVMDTDEEIAALFSAPHEGDDTVLIIVAVDPLEAVPVEIDLPESLVIDVELVQCLGVCEHLRMHRVLLDEMPVKTVVEVPLDELPVLTAHEEQLLAGMCHPIAEEATQPREFLPVVARHFADERALAVHDLIMRERQDKVLGECVHE